MVEVVKVMCEMMMLWVKFLFDFFDCGYDVLVSDVDVVWLRDFREWMREAMIDVDVVASTDCFNVCDDDEGKCWGVLINMGIFYFNVMELVKKFIVDWVDGMEKVTEDITERD